LLLAPAATILNTEGATIANAAKENTYMNTLKIINDIVAQSFLLAGFKEQDLDEDTVNKINHARA
jgi:hypothetical protein